MKLRDGTEAKDSRLGRLVQFDEKSRSFPVRTLVAPQPLRSQFWPCQKVLDQQTDGACFPAGTMIRRADGSQKPIESIRLLDEVLTAEGRIGRVLQTMVRPSDEMLIVDVRGHAKIRMTPKHPVLTKRGYIAARDLIVGDLVAITRHRASCDEPIDVWSIIDAREFRGVAEGTIMSGGVATKITALPSLLGRTADLGRLLGLYAAEGHTTVNKVVWSFGGHEVDTLIPDTMALIKTCFDAEARVQHRPNGSINVVLYGKLWRRLFAALVPGTTTHGNKYLSASVTSGPEGFRRAILNGWLDGDGHRRRTNVEGVTVSKQLALDMHAIANDLGLRPALGWSLPSKNRHAATRQVRWLVSIPEGSGANQAKQTDAAMWRKVVSVKTEEFSGWVYNFHVEGDKSYVADGLGVHNCVGFAWTHEAVAEPEVFADLTDAHARSLYRRAQELDEWAGSEYSGTSVLAGVKAAQELGWYESYHWAFSIDELALGIGYKGPAVLGIAWHESMFAPGPDGFLKVEGDAVGGHAILCNGVDIEARAFRFHNSWGPSWGLGGECLIHWDDLAKLLEDDGEACLPRRIAGS